MFSPFSNESAASSAFRDFVGLVVGWVGLVLVLREDQTQDIMYTKQALYQLGYP